MDKMVEEVNKEKGWHVGIHVDAASGGFIAPFTSPDLKWDFQLKNVMPLLLPLLYSLFSCHSCLPAWLQV